MPDFPKNEQISPAPGLALDSAAPAANTAAVVSYPAAGIGWANVISDITWSYSGTGTLSGGNLLIQDGSATILTVDVTSQGAGFLPLTRPKVGSPNQAMTITLAAGGASVSGKVNCTHWVMPISVNSGGVMPPTVSSAAAMFFTPLSSMMVAVLAV